MLPKAFHRKTIPVEIILQVRSKPVHERKRNFTNRNRILFPFPFGNGVSFPRSFPLRKRKSVGKTHLPPPNFFHGISRKFGIGSSVNLTYN